MLRARLAAGVAAGLAAGVALFVTGCVALAPGAAGAPPLLYVTNALDSTITPLDPATGRVAGAPLPAGPSPWQIAPGPNGGLLVLSATPWRAGELTHVQRAGTGWSSRLLVVDHGARETSLASDGVRYTVLAFNLSGGEPGTGRCRLALVDVPAGVVERTTVVCGANETVTGVALAGGLAGPVAYLGITSVGVRPAAADLAGNQAIRSNRVVAIRAATGAVAAILPLAGTPSNVLLTAAPGEAGLRLYAAETRSPLELDSAGGYSGRLLGLDPATLEIESEHPLRSRPGPVAVSPDGGHAYILIGAGHSLMHLDLTTGAERTLASLPDAAVSLAVTDTRIYVPNPFGREVWAVDRRTGRLVRTIPVGRSPVGIAIAR